MGPGRYLIADSYRGVVLSFDAATQRAQRWLESPLLARADDKNPLPAANGIRRDGISVLISNSARRTLVRAPLKANGSAGERKLSVAGVVSWPD